MFIAQRRLSVKETERIKKRKRQRERERERERERKQYTGNENSPLSRMAQNIPLAQNPESTNWTKVRHEQDTTDSFPLSWSLYFCFSLSIFSSMNSFSLSPLSKLFSPTVRQTVFFCLLLPSLPPSVLLLSFQLPFFFFFNFFEAKDQNK